MKLTDLKYVSEAREKQFNKMGVFSQEDLVRLYPRDFLDLTRTNSIFEAYHNSKILIACEVLNVENNRYARRPYVKALCRQGEGLFQAIWFNQPYVATKLTTGEFLFYGRVQNKYGMGASLVNPTFEKCDKVRNLQGILPVYPLSGTLTQGAVRTAVRQALKNLNIASAIPLPLQRKYGLSPLKEAYNKLHNPLSQGDIDGASERIAVEEYFLLVSAFKVIKGDGEIARLNKYSVTDQNISAFLSRFPFEFTDGQKGAVGEIISDLRSPKIMNRLLQGDVGCGKTAVALTAVYAALKSGYQAAMLAPTEVLARQNAEQLKKYLPEYNVRFLSGSTSAAEKREIKAGLKDGTVNAVCGTHAVLQKDVYFKNLSLVVCDEQQRFGVAQRSALTEKGDGCDCLVMSATPIPRTLSLVFYGDLDVTTIKEKPRLRQDISTSIIKESKYADMLNWIGGETKRGRQAYFVCPKIEGDDEGTVMSVTELLEDLQKALPTVRFGLLHGKMNDKKKDEVMAAFKNKEYDCLVSTTVIEVGVDVPDATVMVIYNADRFGLSQLHQLRGRVGRGSVKSYCFLLSDNDSDIARERLAVLKNNSDGFAIAEFDLKLRGGGDFMGTRQSGRILTELKNLRFPVSAVFTAKAISDDAFSGAFDTTELRRAALRKYDSLKDVILN
ncbi:MAG: ATP-dependent DNA helicase RecG [Clostridia bacterium]|nr:ATP-dependent DNA helicase RecG [Clostridia bacterium]